MSEREQRVNQGLRILDEAHYSGRISREEYRKRRRQLLGSLCDSHGITARNTLRTRITQQGGRSAAAVAGGSPPPASRPARRAVAWKPLLAFAGGLLLCALLLYWLMQAD
ncbi:SHOCT domain-containing protein [Rhodanobacter sp. DHB23]|uniref:SHOCT domain-containing protein n=1 Tax=Rhodanobacter sp. DHB23 TaxID=2775923 RepID=UPI001781F0C9|nr:SHOCT domain-containing protein [Rhodanobacter sp. DHB23]MBD8871345.1 SHOCT domain-containing protein [Rhodanobacter sp. DHB23]